MDEKKAEGVSASKDTDSKSEGREGKPNLRRGVVFITPNNEYYRNKNPGFGWAITHETKTELTWGEDVKEEPESLIELVGGGKEGVRAEIVKRAEEIEKQFEGEVCEVCGNTATGGIPEDEGDNTIYLCDDCYAERGIEGEEIEEVRQ